MLLLWHVSLPQGNDLGWDSYSEFIVAAMTEQQARSTYPNGGGNDYWINDMRNDHEWIRFDEIHTLIVTCIGIADVTKVQNGQVIVSSYHAG